MQCNSGSATVLADCQFRPDQPMDWNQSWIDLFTSDPIKSQFGCADDAFRSCVVFS